jgi:glycosyltransferase involved in cell wall biosynthesis
MWTTRAAVKGIEVLVEAIPLVLERAPRSRFVFVGDDLPAARGESWRQRLQKRLQAKGVAERVRFQGSLSQNDLLDQYHSADIGVVPTLNYESFSYTCCEAMAAGLPVVASRIGGIPETVEDGRSGILVTPGNVGELASSLVKLVESEELRRGMGSAGRLRAKREFDCAVVAERMVEVFQSVIDRARSTR